MSFIDWAGAGAFITVFMAMVTVNFKRISDTRKTSHEHDLAIAYLKGRTENVSNEVKLVVYEALHIHEQAELKKFEELKAEIGVVQRDVAVIKARIGRAINGAGEH